MAVILTYNVNGLRAAYRKGFAEWLVAAGPDIICLQEVKALPEQLDLKPLEAAGYRTYWAPAEKKGYSGVAIFSKLEPQHVEVPDAHPLFHQEGRLLRADYSDFTLLSAYFPSGASKPERQAQKMVFLEAFGTYIEQLMKERPNIIIAGDFNIAHQAIDLHNPQRNLKSPGFLPEERNWFSALLELGFTDAFRHFNTEPQQYTWWSYRSNSRPKNLGWRIDYQVVSRPLTSRLKRAVLLSRANHSDHCPVLIEL